MNEQNPSRSTCVESSLLPRWLKWTAMAVGIPAFLVVGARVYADATVTTFKDGDALSAAAMNANFKTLADAINALQTSNTAIQASYTAQQIDIASLKNRVASLESVDCPRGYVRDAGTPNFTLCTKALEGGQVDEVVRVGDFWVDRYEMSSCGGDLGSGPGYDVTGVDPSSLTTAIACSAKNVVAQGSLTWFQSALMCQNARKHLCSNAEWQAASSGTIDPGANDGSTGQCNTNSSGPRKTGLGSLCQSRFGAEDMIGNLWEWVADWYQAGLTWQTTDGQAQSFYHQPSNVVYGADSTFNVNGRTYVNGSWWNGAPTAGGRGGEWTSGTSAGTFALDWGKPPHYDFPNRGGRCCMSSPQQAVHP